VLEELLKLLRNADSNKPRIVWLNGFAGTGKSTIASTIAHSLSGSQNLGGSFFFSRNGTSQQTDAEVVFSTFAREPANRVPRLSNSIVDVLRFDSEIGNSAIDTQFERLIASPLETVTGLCLPVVIILDALDECKQPAQILSVIARGIPRLPHFFRLLVTSRPEHDIRGVFDNMKSAVHQVSLNANQHLDRDIAMFIRQNMSALARRHGLPVDWPDIEVCNALLEKARGLFIWISTAMKFISDEEVDDPESQLDIVLDSKPNSSLSSTSWSNLDFLYLQVLTQSLGTKLSERRLQLFQKIVGTIVVLRDPLSPVSLEALFSKPDIGTHSVVQVTRKLQSVLSVPAVDIEPIQIIHPSFVNFITSAKRCQDTRFFVEPAFHDQSIVCCCLRLMHKSLHRNICRVESYPLNSEIDDPAKRIDLHIPEVLRYATRFWADHLLSIPPIPEVVSLLKTFYFEDLLFWIEVSSLLGNVRAATEALDTAQEWLLVRHCDPHVLYSQCR
jgi:hypothetical protein